MRVDFEKSYLSSDEDKNWLRMMRGARAVAASIVIAAVGALTFSALDRSPAAPLLDATNHEVTSHEYDRGIAASAVVEPLESKSAPAAKSAPAIAEEWKDPTLNTKETIGLLG
jgi:hypothetical protein